MSVVMQYDSSRDFVMQRVLHNNLQHSTMRGQLEAFAHLAAQSGTNTLTMYLLPTHNISDSRY